MATKADKDGEIFENVEFVAPKPKIPTKQPLHPFVDNSRKRKDHPVQDEADTFTQPPPSKRAKTSHPPKPIHPGYSSAHSHHKRSKPSNYYQKKWKQHKNSTNASHFHQPTLQEMENHDLFKIAKQHWLSKDAHDMAYDAELIDRLYFDYISSMNEESNHNIIILEFSQYLESYLWRYFDYKLSSNEHILSMIYCLNQKFDDEISVWTVLINSDYFNYAQSIQNSKNEKDEIAKYSKAENKEKNMQKLSLFFQRIFEMKVTELKNKNDRVWNKNEKSNFLLFLIYCFYQMENESIRRPMLKLIGLPLFDHLNTSQKTKLFSMVPSLQKLYKKYTKNKEKIAEYQRILYPLLMNEFFVILKECESLHKVLNDTKENNKKRNFNLNALKSEYLASLNYIYCFLDLMNDNLSLLITRRYLRPFLESSKILFLIQCKFLCSPLLYKSDSLFRSLLDKIEFYVRFEIDDFDGRSLSDNEMRLESYHKFVELQQCVYKNFYAKCKDMALATISSLDHGEKLKKYLNVLTINDLYDLSEKLHILPKSDDNLRKLLQSNDINTNWTEKDLLVGIFCHFYLSRKSKREQINNLPLYPTEKVLFDDSVLYLSNNNNEENEEKQTKILALDKINLQFLTMYDYLLRNYNLYKLESAHSIRDDIARSIWKIRPRLKRNPMTKLKDTVFTGYSRYALPIDEFSITSVKKANLGEIKPSKVVCEVCVDLQPFHDEVLSEWKDLRQHDVLFLVRLRAAKDLEQDNEYLYSQKVNEEGIGNKRWDELSAKELGIEYVRGCQILDVRDGDAPDRSIGEINLETREVYEASGSKRIYDVSLDCAQYQLDITDMIENEHKKDVYAHFNLLIRRKGKENNFKSVLNTLCSLMKLENNQNVFQDRNVDKHTNDLLPKWFQPLFLGYGNPQSAAYYNLHKKSYPLPNIAKYDEYVNDDSKTESMNLDAEVITDYKCIVNDFYCMDFKDTFIDFDHVKSAFVGYKIKKFQNEDNKNLNGPPFRIWFSKNMKPPNHEQILENALNDGQKEKKDFGGKNGTIIVESYYNTKRDEYGYDANKLFNKVRYTSIQTEAIKSGMHYGLTLVVGPPGSGKTDVAVQIISNLYANFGKNERILLVTHSNSALNDLFEKLIERDIDERHLLRLGYGHKSLSENVTNEYDFSKRGRIDYMLNERINKLKIAQFLAKTLNISEQSGYCGTAETCAHFKTMTLMQLWEDFEEDLDKIESVYADKLKTNDYIIKDFVSTNGERKNYENIAINQIIDTLFPFKTFIASSFNLQCIFALNESYSYNKALAYKYWQYILSIFDDIKQCHVFELLRTTKDRAQYLLTRQAKVVAMTCTHAAIKRDEFLSYNFEYDTLIMEEAGQVLDIETFIPMVLQKSNKRLKRIILIGDHYQLPPIIKNRTFAKYSKLDQSLFSRLIRLNVPYHLLNMQGRCRPSIRALWSWRYPYSMGDLELTKCDMYNHANTGFYFDYQFIDVSGFEYQPNPYFYQNLNEAEYVVTCYQYMRLLGYPSEKITILTTYNGQKQLLKEIFAKKCVNDPLYGAPHKISTVDKYQGSQNDYVLLSLVRTNSVGYIRDVRRLIVAVSRSRFGLYVFGCSRLFQQCYELKNAFDLLLKRPVALTLVTNESYPTNRKCDDELVMADYDNPNVNDPTKREYFECEGLSHFMHVVNRMSNAVRSHFRSEYEAKLAEYKERARAALAEKRKIDRKREQEKEKEKENEVVVVEVVPDDDNDDDVEMKQSDGKSESKKKKSDKEEMDASDEEENEDEKKKEVGLNSKEQFDLAAQMALMRSNQIMHDEQEDAADESSEEEEQKDENDENIEYESSSESSSD